MFHIEIKNLFEGHPPTMTLFEEKLSTLPAKECKIMLEKAYYSTLYEFDAKSKTYRHFYGLLVRKDRQRYRDFLLTKTLLGQLRPLLYNPELLIRIAFALEQQSDQKKVQTMDLVFSMSLAFDFPQKINTLNQYLKTHKLTPCDLTDLKESILMESPDWPKR